MPRLRNIAILLLCAGCAVACSLLDGIGAGVSGVVSDPEVQRQAGGVVQDAISGNWLGAAGRVVELLATAGVAYKAAMIRRDSLRKKRGEPVGKEAKA